MPIAAFNVTKMFAERKSIPKSNFKIKPDILINNIVKEDLKNLDKAYRAIKFIFEYNLKYEPNIGEISIKGEVGYVDEIKKIDDILKAWEKNKILSSDIMALLVNVINLRSSLKAFHLQETVGLPPHLRLPILSLTNVKKSKENYIG